MKKIVIIAGLLGLCTTFASCELDKFPETGYNEHNVVDNGDNTDSAIKTREDLSGQLTAMYNFMRNDCQTLFYQHFTAADCRADNAYGGGDSGKPTEVEANTFNSDNEIPTNLWDGLMKGVNAANQVICNMDVVKANDPSLTESEYQSWRSQALCWRAYCWLMMTQYFGEIPMLTEIPPAITSDNIEEVYALYFPKRVDAETLKAQLDSDLEYACQYAPDYNAADKSIITKGFAYGLVARMYAQKQFRDWGKVKSACEAVEGMGYSLCDKYGDMWGYVNTGSVETKDLVQTAVKNTRESIFELQWEDPASGHWMWMMFYRNAFNPNESFSWIKWCTPSRNLAAAYDAEGDTERKNVSIRYDACTWEALYPKDNYAFMGKFPTNISTLYVMRYADIRLLHAEALANTNDASGAADIVDVIRGRAKIAKLTAAQRGSVEAMKEAVLHERRLELAFEGHRWFDLMRFGDNYSKIKTIHDNANVKGSSSYDAYTAVRTPLTDSHLLMPIPTGVLENNPNLEQNLGW